MHTSPVSTGETSLFVTNLRAVSSRSFKFLVSYAENISASIALDSNVLSTPHNTSPCGLPAVSAALVTNSPASPPSAISTLTPVSRVNSSKIFSDGVNESYARSVKVTWSELSLCDGASVWPVEESLCGESFEQALAIAASRTVHKNRFFKFLLLNSLLILFSLSFDV